MPELGFENRDGWIWLDGEIVPWREARLHVLSHGLHYASSVFEGERAYNGSIFKSEDHSRRFRRSAELLDFVLPYSVELLEQAKYDILARNGLTDGYLRPVAWRGAEQTSIAAPDNKVHVAIACWEWLSYFDEETKMKGIKIGVAEFRRPDPMTAPSAAKAAGLYMICTISKHRAMRAGYADALMLDWQGRVAECTGANIFFVKAGELHTPIADCFLDGITRRTVIELARQLSIPVVERRILPDELSSFEECFVTGSAAEITPVASIEDCKFRPAAATKAIMNAYTAATRRGTGRK